jgi:hypothetical protein
MPYSQTAPHCWVSYRCRGGLLPFLYCRYASTAVDFASLSPVTRYLGKGPEATAGEGSCEESEDSSRYVRLRCGVRQTATCHVPTGGRDGTWAETSATDHSTLLDPTSAPQWNPTQNKKECVREVNIIL